MECYKEYPRSVGILTGITSLVYLLAGLSLLLNISKIAAIAFFLLYLGVQLVYYPAKACRNCYYRGRNCISLKGRWCQFLMDPGNESDFPAGMRKARKALYLLWLFPFLILILAQLFWRPLRLDDLILAAMLIALSLMRQLMRRHLGCRVCMMRENCPNPGADPRRPVSITHSPAGSKP
ncbi:MAG: hypothetical protein QF492_00575 [Candidatus Krumholzibacteria bacterium]|jgi:hypothetical protein|nr:hypothetical protein [Candidatus Krumholzibacteria bacterium]MDP6668386.1 hypothetical protein [Candidatus Krumholzibacteria bacterium]MDP6797434.1 hypothetical protein [Candidatus Krumholzibacteria bacterium]MDP7022161.1 hypothetical protein [Candidatus Krumholzibacteria bacterium]